MKIPVAQGVGGLPELPGPRLPIAAGERPGEELAQIGAQGQQLAQQWQLVENRLELARQSVESTKFLTDLTEKARGLIENPNTTMSSAEYAGQVQKTLTDDVNEHVKAIPNAVIRARMQTQLLHHVNTLTTEARRSANVAVTKNLIADDLQQQEKELKQYAVTGDPEILATRLARGHILVASKIYAADKWEAHRQTFLDLADERRAIEAGMVNPRQTSLDVMDETKYPYLTPEKRHSIGRTLHAEAKQQEDEDTRNLHDFQSSYEGWLIVSMGRGEFTGQQAAELAQANGLTGPQVGSIRARGDQMERTAGKVDHQASVNKMEELWVQIPVEAPTTRAGLEAANTKIRSIISTAQGVMNTEMNPEEVARIQDHARGILHGNLQAVQGEEGRLAREEDKQRVAKARSLRLEFNAVSKEIDSLLAIDVANSPDLKEVYHEVKNRVLAGAMQYIEPEAAETDKMTPRQYVVQNLTSAKTLILGGIPQVVVQIRGKLKHKTFDDLMAARGSMDPADFVQQYDYWRELNYLKQFIQAAPTSSATEGAAVPKPYRPPEGENPLGPEIPERFRGRRQTP